VIVGSHAFIKEARRIRKSLGAGMRQVGFMAAAGLVAIHEMIDRLAEDHENACLLAEGLATIPAIEVNPERVRTNFVFFRLRETARLKPDELTQKLRVHYNIRISPYKGDNHRFRCLTHYWITRERVYQVIDAMRALLQ
jgi:threonine aldolase